MNNVEREYKMDLGWDTPPHIIEKTQVERDLGIMISNDLKWVHQIEKAVQAAKAIISQIRNSFTYFDAELVRLLYVSLIRPHLEYAVPVWNPYLRGDIDRVKTLKQLGIRRKRWDLIQFYKIINKIDHMNGIPIDLEPNKNFFFLNKNLDDLNYEQPLVKLNGKNVEQEFSYQLVPFSGSESNNYGRNCDQKDIIK